MNEPTHIDLFSGIGGFSLAAKWAGFRTIVFCEIDKYCQRVLAKNFSAVLADTRHGTERIGSRASRREDGEWASERQGLGSRRPAIYSDIFDFDGTRYRGCSILTGGFPCQPFSVAGKRRGKEDDRAIWPEMLRVIKEARPAFVLAENVPGIITMELDNVLSDLEAIGYATRPFTIPACAVDARHRRDRVWIVAKSSSNLDQRTRRESDGASEAIPKLNRPKHDSSWQSCRASQIRETSEGHAITANTKSARLERLRPDARQPEVTESRNGSALANSETVRCARDDDGRTRERCELRRSTSSTAGSCRWLPEPDVGRVAHGVPSRVDRLRGLGNAIVPQVAFEILREIRLSISNG